MSEATKKAMRLVVKLRGFIIAAAVVLIIIGALVAYSGAWPPLVVVESPSMQHSSTESYFGVIDTGDMVILKKIGDAGEIRTYLEGLVDGYQTYGGYGDVVIYKPYGSDSRTPILHRVLLRLEYNATGGGFDIPSLADIPPAMWSVVGGTKDWHNLKTVVVLTGIGYNQVTVNLDLSVILGNFARYSMVPFGGLITLGDHNHGIVDQMTSICWAPIKDEWVSGVGRGEIPWFGLLKLWISGPTPEDPVPENSKTGLFISLGLLIGGPIVIDAASMVLERKGKHPGAWLRSKLRLGKKPEDAKEPSDEKKPDERPKAATEPRSANQKSKKGKQ